ncbi:hypothetical protein F4813DRAFT_286753 [Daldinia decipiens]|uniref:uncharacterized protein n=1 Tax=Daldinia decipiens TaxID=326647 RepID=UPI0020C47175|nr:uncharacterized protein F4813DRAFT_286753 [Daldinia decipiens]KAI1652927.1 hypothetical protein F4813DRAFT_286753 [Daldinia decipiens]
MAGDYDYDLPTINRWIAQGKLTKDHIMSRLDGIVQNGVIGLEDKQALQATFASASSCAPSGDGDTLTELAFISLLQSKAGLPRNPEGAEVGKIIYEMLVYLSTLPFPTRPHHLQPEGLTLVQIARALAWALSDRNKYIFDECNHSRMRTRSDHDRIIFQSLANSTVPATMQDEVRRRVNELAHRNLFDVNEFFHDLCGLNNDADGDEIYHDLLEVIYSTQEEVPPGLANVPRDKFRSIAKQIKADEKLPELHTLSIPVPRLEVFVKVMLALQFETVTSGQNSIELSQFDDAARCICTAFIQDQDESQGLNAGASGVITWPSYHQALRTSSPYLLYPFYRLLTLAFLDKPGTFDIIDSSEPIPHIPADAVLTRSRASQLNTFLAHSTYGPDLRRMKYYVSSNLPTPAFLAQAIQDVPDEAIVLFAGQATGTGPAKGKLCVFGLFSPKPKEDRSHILARADFRPNAEGQQQCTLFQLAPSQDLYQGVAGAAGWSTTVDADGSENVIFGRATSIDDIGGERGGVVLTLRDGLRRGEVRHRGRGVDVNIDSRTDSRAGEVTYKANPSRSDWVLEFDIDKIEIWSEINGSESN